MAIQRGHEFHVFRDESELTDSWRELLSAARNEIRNSYAPYSGFNVVASARLNTGDIVTGSNQENSSFQAGICAERNLVFHAMHTFKNLQIDSLLVYAEGENHMKERVVAPCGICRQVLAEQELIQSSNLEVLFPGENGSWILSEKMDFLLPFAFRLK